MQVIRVTCKQLIDFNLLKNYMSPYTHLYTILWLQGERISGYYQVHSGLKSNEGQFQTVFCDFEKNGSQNELSPVIKFEVLTGSIPKAEAYQSFDWLIYGSHSYFDLASGTFTVPKTGMYQFWAGSILGNAEGYARLRLHVNGQSKGLMAYIDLNGITLGNSANLPYTLSKTLKLNAGDKVRLYSYCTVTTIESFRFRGELLF